MIDPIGAHEPRRIPKRTPRHDAFDGKRRRAFLDALGKCGCLRDAARRAGVSHQTVYNHQARDPQFARQCALALDMAGTDIELRAWERGVVGVEEPIVYRGEIVGTRLKRSDAILKLLLQGTKRKKYGPNPGFSRRRLARAERLRIEEELRAEDRTRRARRKATAEETDARLNKQLDNVRARMIREGWSVEESGHLVPPGWVRGETAPPAPIHSPALSPVGALPALPLERAEQMPDSV